MPQFPDVSPETFESEIAARLGSFQTFSVPLALIVKELPADAGRDSRPGTVPTSPINVLTNDLCDDPSIRRRQTAAPK
jgi:hypothetical protein